jgi:hypothetical protein
MSGLVGAGVILDCRYGSTVLRRMYSIDKTDRLPGLKDTTRGSKMTCMVSAGKMGRYCKNLYGLLD